MAKRTVCRPAHDRQNMSDPERVGAIFMTESMAGWMRRSIEEVYAFRSRGAATNHPRTSFLGQLACKLSVYECAIEAFRQLSPRLKKNHRFADIRQQHEKRGSILSGQ